MQKRILYLFLIVLIMFPLISFVSAAPSVTTTQNFASGFAITDSQQYLLKQNQNYTYSFFLNNLSNGLPVDNSDVSCTFYIANNNGSLIYSSSVPYADGHWGLNIDGNNFSQSGEYAYGAECNSSTLGGSISGMFKVTSTGLVPIDTSTSFLILSIMGIIALAGLCFLAVAFLMNNQILKTILIGLGCFTMAILIFLGVTITQQMLGDYSWLGTSYYYFFWFMLTTIFMTTMTAIVWLFFYAIKQMQTKKRGSLED